MFTISLSINPIITHLTRQGWIEDPVGRTIERGERGRGGNFAKLSSSSLRLRRAPHAALPVLRERAARRREKCNAFMHSDTATAAGEGRRAERRTGGGGARRRSLFCPLPPPSLSVFAAAVQKLAEVFVPAGAPRCGRTDTDGRCVCLAGAADDRVRVLHFVRRQTDDGPDPSARPPGQRKLAKFSTDAAADGAVPASSRVGPFSPSWPDVVV